MKNLIIYISTTLAILLIYSCDSKEENTRQSSNTETNSTESKQVRIEPLCGESDKEKTLRLEVSCKHCEVKYSLMKDAGNEENKQKIKGIWCHELKAEPTDIIGLFATKLKNGKPIEYTLESIKFKEGINADTIEVRTYYNNILIKKSIGNGYAGISMLKIPRTKFDQSKMLKLSECIGKNIFDVVNEHSNSSPETLIGTDNEKWIVYYQDIDVTFTVKKKTNSITKANKGKNKQ